MSPELPPVALAIADLIGRRLYALGAVLEDRSLVARDPEPVAVALAASLLAGDRDAGASVLELAWPDSDPPSAWWSTPLGAVTALATAEGSRLDVELVAAVLGVTTAAVVDDLGAGRLELHPDGGATLSSVRALLADERPEIA